MRLGVVTISKAIPSGQTLKGGTPLGVKAKRYIDAGDLVPDSVTKKMVRDQLSESDLYHQHTEAVVAKYDERGILTQVEDSGAIDVTDRLLRNANARLSLSTLMTTLPSQ